MGGRPPPTPVVKGDNAAARRRIPGGVEFRPAMNPRLERMIQLQRVESELKRAQAGQAEIPKRKMELEAELAAERAHLDAARASLDETQKARRRHEGSLQDLEGKRSRYKGQLMEVKTNKEYTAMLHEIETVEREIRAREDQILQEMERAETLAVDLKREEEAFGKAEARQREEGQALDSRSQALTAEAARFTAERDAVAAKVPPDLLELFQRVARLRGVAVAEAKDGKCQVCHLTLRPQMYVDLKKNEEIVQCPACNRILFYEPPPPTVDVRP
jgi:uncharacterized protein